MQMRQAFSRKTLLILLAFTLVTAGCSRMNLAYRNLDLLIPWSLNDYLDMNRDQQQHFRAQLREHLGWHCRTQLPDYLDSVELLQGQVRQGEIDEPVLHAHYRDARQAIQTIAVEITPTTTQLLRDLDNEQVRELGEALEKDRRERDEKYLQPPLAEQIRERSERMRERIDQWLGSSSAAQRQRILEWAHALGDQNRLWLGNRVQWQQALIAALDQRQEPEFAKRIETLLQDREALWSADYRAAFARAEQVTIDLVSDVYALSDPAQRRHLDEQLEDLRKDLSSLDCLANAR